MENWAEKKSEDGLDGTLGIMNGMNDNLVEETEEQVKVDKNFDLEKSIFDFIISLRESTGTDWTRRDF